MNRKNTTILTSLLFATTLAGCSGPMTEPKREAHQSNYLRTQNGVSIMDVCNGTESGSDGIADMILIGIAGSPGVYQYQIIDPACRDRRSAVTTLPMTPELQAAATQTLHAYGETEYLTDRAVWESRTQK